MRFYRYRAVRKVNNTIGFYSIRREVVFTILPHNIDLNKVIVQFIEQKDEGD